MKKYIHILLVTIMLTLAACTSAPPPSAPSPVPLLPEQPTQEPYPQPTNSAPVDNGETDNGQIQQVRSDIQRQQNPEIPAADLQQAAAGNSRFAFDLYQSIKDEDGNLFYSPYSISLALAMIYAGASGNTEAQMAEALHFDLPQERLHPAFNALDQALASRGQRGNEPDSFALNIVNSIWGQRGYDFTPAYLDALALHYGAGLRLMDFNRSPEEARQVINEWVSEQTEERIQDLLPEGVVDDLTRLVLVNAIYFNARWASPFEEENTQPGPFELLDGSSVEVPLMRQTEIFGYNRGDDYQVIELPYDGHELSMVILLPDQGSFSTFEENLDDEQFRAAVENMERVNMNLSMPKFSYDSDFALSETLRALGMSDAFTAQVADFSGIDGTQNLYIKDVIHKAFVAVDEAGTEAAAATGVVAGITSMPPEPINVDIDRPFIYLIRDIETGTILFIGRVLNPAS